MYGIPARFGGPPVIILTNAARTELTFPSRTTVLLGSSRGRLASVTQGARLTTYAYGTDGYLASVTDPLLRTTGYTRDAVGRVTSRDEGNAARLARSRHGL